MLKGFVSGEEKDIKRIPMKGKNLFDVATLENGIYLAASGNKYGDITNGVRAGTKIKASPNTTYTLSAQSAATLSLRIFEWSNGTFTKQTPKYNISGSVSLTVTTDAETTEIAFNIEGENGQYATNIMLNLGSTALPYEPYGYQEGWEVRDNQDRLIWGREDEFEGTDSIPIKGCGTPLTSVTIKGNGQQNGTPSPQNILPFDGTGERTGNLFDISTVEKGRIDNGVVGYASQTSSLTIEGESVSFTTTANYRGVCSGFFEIPEGTEAISFNFTSNEALGLKFVFYDDTKIWLNQDYTPTLSDIPPATANVPSGAKYVRLSFTGQIVGGYSYVMSNIMLNTGSTALPYEPYGYKIPLTAASVTTPLYLGEVSTTRRIKKLVLTGEEANWYYYENTTGTVKFFYLIILRTVGVNLNSLLNTHGFSMAEVTQQSGNILIRVYAVSEGIGTVEEWKSYLAAQYATGTPVTVWYVLASPETGIVNEPLMKIGDYADTLTTSTPIPTTTGATDVTVDTVIPPSELTIKVHAKKIRYGFKIDKSQENSESAVIYTHDAVTMTPAVMDFTNDRFSYGSWENAWFVRDARPCALKLDGTVAYYLDPNDATKKLDGTASDIYYELLSTEPADWSTQWKQYYQIVSGEYVLNDQNSAPTFATNTYYKLTYNSSFTGNFMVEFPQVWFYRHEDTSYNYIEISNYKLSDDWKCYAHINANGQEVDFIYLPMFKGVIKDSKLRSLPGQIPQGNTTATTEVNAATALGSRWQIWDHSSVECLNDLLTLMSKSIDSQGRFGQGRSTGYDSTDTVTYGKLQTGTLIKGGKFHGFSSSYKEVKVFGIEGFWANRWDRLQGMLLVNNVWKIKMTPPYNFTGTDFVTLSNASVPTRNGYLSKVQTSEYGSIPASIDGGSSTKYFKDYFYKTATDTRVAIRGGNCGNGANCGFRSVDVSSAASDSYWDIGASPVYK